MKTVELYADDGGTGTLLPVIFLHSTAGNAWQWAAQLEHLRPQRRAVALEWRGHGRSDLPTDGDYSFPAMAADVDEAVKRLGTKRFVLVGHSGGGLVALQYAADHSERVAGLLLADPAGDARRIPQMASFLEGLASDAYAETIEGYWNLLLTGAKDAVREQVMADLRVIPKETVVGFFRVQVAYDPSLPLRRYEGLKRSVITPANDTPFGLHNLGADLPYETLEGTGHWLHLDKPEAFNQVMNDFIKQSEEQHG